MDRQGRVALVSLTFIYLITFLAMTGYSMFIFPGRDVLAVMRADWILWNSVAYFIEVLPTAHLTAILLIYSLFAGIGPVVRMSNRALVDVLHGPLVLFTIITMLFALAVGLLQPYAVARRDSAVYRSEFAAALLQQAEQFARDGEYARAAVDFALYLTIDPENDQARAQLEQARAFADAPPDVEPAPDSPFRAAARREGPDATALANRAAAAIAEQDFFSAHYYARLALDLDPGREEARLTLTAADESMRAFGGTLSEQADRDLYERKRRAHQLLLGPDGDSLIEAYYAFDELRREHPDDRDVQRYYPLALEAVKQVSFFLHEIEQAEGFPTRHNLTFRNGRHADIREFIHVDRLVLASAGRYAMGIEAIAFDEAGEVLYHLQADYGKLGQSDAADGQTSIFLNMRAVDRERRTITEPRYLTGQRGAAVSHVLELNAPLRRLELIAAAEGGLSSTGLPDLLQKARLYPLFGVAVEPVLVEIGMRLLLPFSLLLFSLLGVSFGIRWRSRYLGRAAVLTVLALGAVPFVVHHLIVIYFFGFRVLLGFLTLHASLAVAVAVFALSQALLLAWALFSVAGQLSAQ